MITVIKERAFSHKLIKMVNELFIPSSELELLKKADLVEMYNG